MDVYSSACEYADSSLESHPQTGSGDSFESTFATVRRRTRPRTAATSTTRANPHQIICAINESRGVSPTVGLAFIDINTSSAVLCQICDSQTYVRTIHKLMVYSPVEVLIAAGARNVPSKLMSVLEENLDGMDTAVTMLDRRYWTEASGLEYIQQLAFDDDIESIKIAVDGNFFAICCFSAVRINAKISTVLSPYVTLCCYLGYEVRRISTVKKIRKSYSSHQI